MRFLVPIVLIGLLVGCKAKQTTVALTPATPEMPTKNEVRKEQVVMGTLLRKAWTKSAESYCAQGSDYYVLKTANESLVLQFRSYPDSSMLNKAVTITGFVRTRIIYPEEGGQHPVADDDGGYQCSVFVVEKIEMAE